MKEETKQAELDRLMKENKILAIGSGSSPMSIEQKIAFIRAAKHLLPITYEPRDWWPGLQG